MRPKVRRLSGPSSMVGKVVYGMAASTPLLVLHGGRPVRAGPAGVSPRPAARPSRRWRRPACRRRRAPRCPAEYSSIGGSCCSTVSTMRHCSSTPSARPNRRWSPSPGVPRAAADRPPGGAGTASRTTPRGRRAGSPGRRLATWSTAAGSRRRTWPRARPTSQLGWGRGACRLLNSGQGGATKVTTASVAVTGRRLPCAPATVRPPSATTRCRPRTATYVSTSLPASTLGSSV